ncbi:MAG TPA: fused MFS/spermidine synthase [Lacipirellulaceae bacterium]|nr:fused MFS/spermidine synthase [Lacipirellulaceae bacterium]
MTRARVKARVAQGSAAPVSPAPSDASHVRGANALLAATALVSAWLLFQVQPLVAKRILPWFGGGTAVWTTAMLFFQTALFAGYAYAHLGSRRLSPRAQVLVHWALLAAAAALALGVGVAPDASWKPPSPDRPTLRILTLLAACVGLPYLMLAATAPLVQVWFARINPGRTPYRLYALSNVGSLAALVSYPLLVEPQLGGAMQSQAWGVAFAVFALLCAASGWHALRRGAPAVALSAGSPDGLQRTTLPPRLAAALWIALPACASVLLLAVTAYLCQDVASLPLLWILPMVVYLGTFILTFDSDRWYRRRAWMTLAALGTLAAVLSWFSDDSLTYLWHVAIHLFLLGSIAMVCHGELVRLRPGPARLTAFYLSIAAGGAGGGGLAGGVAPLGFAGFYELNFAILAALLLAMLVLAAEQPGFFHVGRVWTKRVVAVALLTALAVGMGVHSLNRRSHTVAITRNFYGVLKVNQPPVNDDQFLYYQLANGHISHGIQFRNPAVRRLPTQYYHPNSGVGLTLVAPRVRPLRIGVVGLGIGTLAAYAESDDTIRFYEINPSDVEFADEHFTHLSDARERGAHVEVVLGDARLALERESPQEYDVLAIDAFTGDAIPVHLLTVEAIELYLRHLRPAAATPAPAHAT